MSTALIIYITAIPVVLIIISIVQYVKEIAHKRLIETQARNNITKLIEDTSQSHEWLAGALADISYIADLEISKDLVSKKHPARKAADEIRKSAEEKRELKKQLKKSEYQLEFLKNMFPWLSDYMELSSIEAAEYALSTDDDYDKVNNWLSPEEYQKLPTQQKNQLALDRWRKRKKSDWEAGRDYERYIGYIYEKQGYTVEYVGAIHGKEDRGVDLIAKKGKHVDVIQCKRYSAIKEHWVRENTVAQIYGVTALYNMENKGEKAKAVIFTSSALSGEAKHFAEYLGVTVKDNFPLDESYPIIKCNINKSGEKIYHLPFDQQYDRVQISGKIGAVYLNTVKEAEAVGFRRAKKWIPNNT